jgi:hypothetical protein
MRATDAPCTIDDRARHPLRPSSAPWPSSHREPPPAPRLPPAPWQNAPVNKTRYVLALAIGLALASAGCDHSACTPLSGAAGITCGCGQTSCPTSPPPDAGVSADTGAARDAVANADVGLPAERPGASCGLADSYRFGAIGGRTAYDDESTISPPNQYRHVRTSHLGAGSTTECAPALPACTTGAAWSLADVAAALGDPDVAAAFARATPPLFGHDSRPVDGQVYSVVRADGHGLLVGGPCAVGEAGCVAIPAGVDSLVGLLRQIDQTLLALPACAGL